MKANEFFEMDEVKKMQEVQKHTPFGSLAHRNAFEEMKRLCAEHMGEEVADTYFGEYE